MTDDASRSRGGTYKIRRGDPLPMEVLDAPRSAGGAASMGLRLDPSLGVEIGGLDDGLAMALRARYAPFDDDGSPAPGAVRIAFRRDPCDYFVTPSQELEFCPVFLAADGPRIRYTSYRVAGWIDPEARRGVLILARGDHEPELRAVENFLRVAVAWRAAILGGALVHAASIVRRGRAYLFYGESGAGKSTLAASNVRGTVLSDDLSLVLPRQGGGLDAVGTPFRGTWEGGESVRGRFPLTAAFRLVQAPNAAVVDVPRIVALGQLVGNLTFVAEAFGSRPDLFERIERALDGVELRHLRFRPDDTFWDAIDRAGL